MLKYIKLLFSLFALTNAVFKLQEHFHWAALDFAYPDNNARVQAILTGRFNPANSLPVGIEIWKDKLFVTVPRWRPGIPSTLNYVPLDSTSKSPVLIPYPDWESNELANCESGLSTVYRIKADACNRLWVLDTGTFGIGNTTQNVCPYTLNVYDLNTNKRIRKYIFRPEDTNDRTFIANIAVDLGNVCDDAHAYFSDELGYGLIVYSWKLNTSWRFSHSFFMPDPLASDFNIAGLNFQWGDEGIFGLALGPKQRSGQRVLYFSPLASNREFAVSTSVLKNSSRVEDSYHEFIALSERGRLGHTTAKVMDQNGIQFFNLIDRNAVGCWNSANSFEPKNIGVVDTDDQALIFPADVKIDNDNYVWVISDRMSTFLLSNLNYNEINFRIFFAPLNILIKDTVCELNQPKYEPIDVNYNFLFDKYKHFVY